MDLVNAKWVNRNLVFYAAGYRQRWLNAVGPNVIKFEMPRCGGTFDNATGDPTWGTCTIVEAGLGGSTTQVAGDARGKGLKVVTDNADYDALNLQAHGAVFQFSVNRPLYFGAKVELADATNTDMYVGLCTTRTAVFTAAAHTIHASTQSHAGFYKLDAGTATKYIGEKAGTASSSSAATMDTSAHIYEMYWDGPSSLANGRITYWVDGSRVGQVTTSNITTGVLRPTFVFRTGNSFAETCYVHWMRAIQIDL